MRVVCAVAEEWGVGRDWDKSGLCSSTGMGGANLPVMWSHLKFSDPVTKSWTDHNTKCVHQMLKSLTLRLYCSCNRYSLSPHWDAVTYLYVPAYLEWRLDWQWWQYSQPQWHQTGQVGTPVHWEAPQPAYHDSWTPSYAVMPQSDVQCHVIQHMCICGLSVHTPEGNKTDLLIKQTVALMYIQISS